ncbi:MAG: ATP phosphoribosyltransferase regulatory subunit [Rhodobacteraceae bacterium]|nr:ATP phosphoribosyltransferase regulatory subunit [Paracoccaceae bacterium]
MKNDRRARIKEVADRLSAGFVSAGALPVETDSLLPADVLLDLYGEDIRARAYVTHDPLQGEQMLRPDFTVPIVQRHMSEGAEPARYTYNGNVWRKQSGGRPAEFTQVGYELFDRTDPAGADAEVFAMFSGMLAGYPLKVTTGDMGILLAAVDGLKTTDRRRAALRRHVWRPVRFVRLLERYGGMTPPPETRTALLAQVAERGAETVLEQAGTPQGLRSEQEVLARIAVLQQDCAAAPVSAEEVQMLEQVLALKDTSSAALETLRDMAASFPALKAPADAMEDRLKAMAARRVDVDTLPFEVSFGRTSMEYYDGFVFGFTAPDRTDLPVVASGGRYDALTRVLGQGRSIAAVGGVIRPEALVAVQEGAL